MLEIYKFLSMSTPCEIHLYSQNKNLSDSCAKDIMIECKRLEQKYNYYDENSYLSELNKRKTNILDSETKILLSSAKQYYKKTNKIFDITLCTIKEDSTLAQYVGCDKFDIKKNKLYFTNEYTKIDLGGFVKEYSVNQAIKIIKKYKITSALVNFGGDIFALGKKPDNSKYNIAITNPKDKEQILFGIEISNQALTTSALYERAGHILSLEELNKNILSVTVVSNCTIKSGVYSTSYMISDDIKTSCDVYKITKDLKVVKNENIIS